MGNEKGFSLVELLIVVAIILILASIAIPNFERSKIAANEASAVATIRVINTGQAAYSTLYQNGYADSLVKLGPPPGGTPASASNADILDWVVGCASQPCPKSGYSFQVASAVTASSVVTSYTLTGIPIVVGRTGNRGFCSTQANDIQFDPAGSTGCSQLLQ